MGSECYSANHRPVRTNWSSSEHVNNFLEKLILEGFALSMTFLRTKSMDNFHVVHKLGHPDRLCRFKSNTSCAVFPVVKRLQQWRTQGEDIWPGTLSSATSKTKHMSKLENSDFCIRKHRFRYVKATVFLLRNYDYNGSSVRSGSCIKKIA